MSTLKTMAMPLVAAASLFGTSQLFAAQLTATWTGSGDGISYNDPANWDIAQVPINNLSDTFIVVIPASTTVNFNVPGVGNEVDEYQPGTGAKLNVDVGFNLAGLNASQLDNALLEVDSGASLTLIDAAYRNDERISETIFSSTGVGALLDLSATTLFEYGPPSGRFTKTIAADAGGMIDLSSLQTIEVFSGQDDYLDFRYTGNGQIDLTGLQSIHASGVGNGSELVRFFFEAGKTYDFPALNQIRNTEYYLEPGTILNLPATTALSDLYLEINGGTINAANVTDLRNTEMTLDLGDTLNTDVISEIDNARIGVEGGRVYSNISDTDYVNNRRVNETIFSATGTGSELDLSSLTLLQYGPPSGRYTKTIAADADGVIDLSGLQTIEVIAGQDDILDFRYTGNGQIDLTNLQNIHASGVGNGSELVRFFFEAGKTYDFPNLNQVDKTDFNLQAGTELNLPLLTDLADLGISINGGTINAANVTDLSNTAVTLSPGDTLNTDVISEIDNARIGVVGGRTYSNVSDGDYKNTRRANETIFSAVGSGSLLDLSSLTLIETGPAAGRYTKTISAEAGAKIDLSGLQTVRVVPGEDDVLDFRYSGNGEIDLSNLQALVGNGNGTERYRFFFEENQTYDFPKLSQIERSEFYLETGTQVNLPVSPALTGLYLEINGGTINAPNASNFNGTQVTLQPGDTLITAQLSEIDQARIGVVAGATFGNVTDETYSNTRRANETIFSANGAGSQLDLSSLKLIQFGPVAGRYTKTVSASAGGLIDLSGVQAIEVVPGEDDILSFVANDGTIDLSGLQNVTLNGNGNDRVWFDVNNGGLVKIGSLISGSKVEITVNGVGSRLEVAKDLDLEAGGLLEALNGAEVAVRGSIINEQTTESQWGFNAGTLVMDGAGGQFFEAAGADDGVDAHTADNFGIKQLVIGRSEQRTSVSLRDLFDNGNRNGGQESLYLFGGGGLEGLVINNNSALILNGINVYAYDIIAGQQVHLNSLFNPGDLRIPFDNGFLQLVPLDFQWDNNLGGDFNVSTNWSDNLVPLPADSAVWNLSSVGGYTVDFGTNVATDSAVIKDDKVTFDLDGNTYSMPAQTTTTGLIVGQDPGDDGQLTVIDGKVVARNIRIAPGNGASGKLTAAMGGTIEATELISLEGDSIASQVIAGDAGIVITQELNLGTKGQLLIQGGGVRIGNGSVPGAGMYEQTSDGKLALTLTDPNLGSGSEIVVSNGSADLAGTLALALDSGYLPDSYSPVSILSLVADGNPGPGVSPITGNFDEVLGVAVNSDYGLAVTYSDFFVDVQLAILGDANLDQAVDVLDLAILATAYGQSGQSWIAADFNGDNIVDILDLAILATSYGQSEAPTAIAVPEPASLALLALGGLMVLRRRCR